LCETSIENGKLNAELTASYHCLFVIFPFHLSNVLHLPRKSDARSYEVLHLSRKIIFPKLKIGCSKVQLLSGNQRADLACHRFGNATNLHVLLTFGKVQNPVRLPRETTSEPPKVARTCSALHILTSKRASCHNGVHLFDISTSKSARRLTCFVHFDFVVCFAPQRRALFRHLNFQKCSEPVSFSHF